MLPRAPTRAKLTPITRPVASAISGPPELPEFTAASVCSFSTPSVERIELTMPRVAVKSRLHGCPKAIAAWPRVASCAQSRSAAVAASGIEAGGMASTARSTSASTCSLRAAIGSPLRKLTRMREGEALATCALVTIQPRARSTTKPAPLWRPFSS